MSGHTKWADINHKGGPMTYDVYVVTDSGVHDVLYGVSKAEADHCAKELENAVVTPAGERPAVKAKAAKDSE